LPEDWQVQFFGENNPLPEYAAGLDPTTALSRWAVD
jgi:hypothetical protein